MGVAAPFVGRWLDRGRAREMMAAGAFVTGAGLILLSRADSLEAGRSRLHRVRLSRRCVLRIGALDGAHDELVRPASRPRPRLHRRRRNPRELFRAGLRAIPDRASTAGVSPPPTFGVITLARRRSALRLLRDRAAGGDRPAAGWGRAGGEAGRRRGALFRRTRRDAGDGGARAGSLGSGCSPSASG